MSLTYFKKKYLNLLFLALIYHCLEKVVAMQLTAVAHKYFINYNLSFVEFSKIVKFYSCFVINVFCFSFFNRNNYIRAFAVLSVSHYTIMKDVEIVKKNKTKIR